jgi:hypothetical protein
MPKKPITRENKSQEPGNRKQEIKKREIKRGSKLKKLKKKQR